MGAIRISSYHHRLIENRIKSKTIHSHHAPFLVRKEADQGGSHESLFRAVTHAIQASKLRWRLLDERVKPLSFAQAFWLATAGGGAFFGKVGRFETGYEFDALVLDDEKLFHPQPLDLPSRLERMVYLADERNLTAKYVAGERLF